MAVKKWQIPLTIIFVFLGVLITTQYRVQVRVMANQAQTSERTAAFHKVLERSETRRALLENEVNVLRDQVAKYKDALVKSRVQAGISEEIDHLRLLEGIVPVEGSGVLMTIDDSMSTIPIWSRDLLDLVNILRYAGAEAIVVNGQRVVANTAIHEAGINILVNKAPLGKGTGAPYEIIAIGDPPKLENYLRATYGLLNELEKDGAAVKIIQQKKVAIPAFSGGLSLDYAKPASVNQPRN